MLTKHTKKLLLIAGLMITASILWTGVIRHQAHRSSALRSHNVVVEDSTRMKGTWNPPGWIEPPRALELLWILGALVSVATAVSVFIDVYRRARHRGEPE
jgi:hypothetical protein